MQHIHLLQGPSARHLMDHQNPLLGRLPKLQSCLTECLLALCLQAQASKLVADAVARSEGYNLTGFLREVGLPAASSAPPAGAQDFALIKREGLKSAAAAAKHGDSSFA